MTDLKKLDSEAIDRKEMAEFERKRLRGTGYEMMKVRDRGWGSVQNFLGGELTVEWNIDGAQEERPDYVAVTKIPKGMFRINIGDTSALVDSESFKRLSRWT